MFNSNSITRWMELNHPNIFEKFEYYSKHSDLSDKNKSIHQQDYTMLIGMLLGFLHQYGMHADIREATIRKEVENLQIKLTAKTGNKKQGFFKSLLE